MITVSHNTTNISDQVIFPTLNVVQNLTNEVDTCEFYVRRVDDTSFAPAFDDDVTVDDGATRIFAGKVVEVRSEYDVLGQATIIVRCVDHTFEMDRILVAKTYTNDTIADIVADLVASYAPGFTATNASSNFVVQKIVFNQAPLSQCLRRLADIVRYDWYVDEDKDIHFFPALANPAPFGLTDTAGNYVYRSLVRTASGSQIVNRVKVRGGMYDGASFTDTITVVGDDTKTFKLPYKFSNLGIELDTGGGFVAQDIGQRFRGDTFDDFDVLYAYESDSIEFENALADGDQIRFTGNPKTPVLAIAEDTASVQQYGAIEKLIRDNSIESNEIARRRAQAELLAFADVAVDARFRTYTPGLRAGMTINVQSDLRDLDDQLIIKAIRFTARTPEAFHYEVECISTQRYTLLDLLRKIITPEARQEDEFEVAEQIFAVNEEVTAADVAEMYIPSDPPEILNMDDYKKLLGAGSAAALSFDATNADALIVLVSQWGPYGITSMEYGGVSLTKDAEQVDTTDGTFKVQVWRLANPASGFNDLEVTNGVPDQTLRAWNMQVYAVRGLNTADLFESEDGANTADVRKELTATQASNIFSLGFMVAHVPVDGGTETFTGDPGVTVDRTEGSGDSQNVRVGFAHRIFTRPGNKTMAMTFSASNAWVRAAEVMALYNGYDPTA